MTACLHLCVSTETLLNTAVSTPRVGALFHMHHPSKQYLMVGPGEAVLAAEKMGAPWTQARSQVALQSHVGLLTSCPFPLRAGRWEEGTGSSQDFWAQPEAGPEHTHSWREAEASEGLVWLLTTAWGLLEEKGSSVCFRLFNQHSIARPEGPRHVWGACCQEPPHSAAAGSTGLLRNPFPFCPADTQFLCMWFSL